MIGSNYNKKSKTGNTIMSERTSIGELHLAGMKDLCVVKDGDPPFSFQRDLQLPAPQIPHIYKNPSVDKFTYWGPR